MKRILDYTKSLDGKLAVALVFMLAGSGFALLNAFGVDGASLSLTTPWYPPF